MQVWLFLIALVCLARLPEPSAQAVPHRSATGAAVTVDWGSVPLATTPATPTYLDQVNPSMAPSSAIHDEVVKRIEELRAVGGGSVRYLTGTPSPL